MRIGSLLADEWAEQSFLLRIPVDCFGSPGITPDSRPTRGDFFLPLVTFGYLPGNIGRYWAASQIGSWSLISRHGAGAGWAIGALIKRSSGRQDPMFIGVLVVRFAVRHRQEGVRRNNAGRRRC